MNSQNGWSIVLALGAEMESAEVLGMEPAEGGWLIHTDSGDFAGRTVILATGARHRRLGLDREESFIGNGISFCAVCDGAFYSGRTVAVIGGGNSALQEALLLSTLPVMCTWFRIWISDRGTGIAGSAPRP